MDIDLTPEARAAAADAETMLSYARDFRVTTAAEYTSAGEELKRIKAKAKDLEAQRVSMTKPLDETKKRILDWFRDPLQYLADAEAAIKRAISAYDAEQRRLQQEAERAAAEAARKERERMEAEAAKAEQAAREKREREEAKARALEAQGRAAEAEAKRKAAEEAEAARMREAEAKRAAAASMPAAPVVHFEQPKVAGVSSRQVWKFEIVDGAQIPREYMVPDEKAIGAVVRALGERANIPGVRVYAETVISSRSA